VLVELDRRHNDGLIVSLEWDRETGKTQIVVEDAWDEGEIAVTVPAASAGDAFRPRSDTRARKPGMKGHLRYDDYGGPNRVRREGDHTRRRHVG